MNTHFRTKATPLLRTLGPAVEASVGECLRSAGCLILLLGLISSLPAIGSSASLRGVIVYGHEERTLSLCGDERIFWVSAAANVREQLAAAVERNTTKPYQPLLIEFEGRFVDRELPGLAGDVDGMIEIDRIHSVARNGVLACKGQASKIRFDLDRLNGDGLQGPPDGLRALHYEFCIPDRPDALSEVRRIDPSLQVYSRSPGRIGCNDTELLCLGDTHQPGHRQVLERLAALEYVTEIREAFFE